MIAPKIAATKENKKEARVWYTAYETTEMCD